MALVTTDRPRVSYADLERWPEDGRRYELYDGEVSVVPSPNLRHQYAVLNIVELLRRYDAEHGGATVVAPFDIVFSDFDVIQPDVVFFKAERKGLLHLDGPARVAPDLAVEVLSPSTERTDRGKKMQMLARYGVGEYWVVDPYDETVDVYCLRGTTYELFQCARTSARLRSATLPHLECAVSGLFDEP